VPLPRPSAFAFVCRFGGVGRETEPCAPRASHGRKRVGVPGLAGRYFYGATAWAAVAKF